MTHDNFLRLSASGIAIGIAYIAFFAGLRIIGPVRASVLMNSEPIYTILLAAIMLGEELSHLQVLGAGLVVGGIIMVNVGKKSSKRGTQIQ
jgi:drug/metabolite transporter (DMT)-like permease